MRFWESKRLLKNIGVFNVTKFHYTNQEHMLFW
jgi:hypothetical protein